MKLITKKLYFFIVALFLVPLLGLTQQSFGIEPPPQEAPINQNILVLALLAIIGILFICKKQLKHIQYEK